MRGLLETACGTLVMTADEASMLDGTARIRPDFAVVGFSPDPDRGAGWLRAIRQRSLDRGVVVLGVHDEQFFRGAAREVGTDAVVLQRAFVADPLGTIQRLRDMTPPRHLPDRS